MNHTELCHRAAKWLKGTKNCVFAVYEVVATCSEIPDAIGFKAWDSHLIEVKMSRADFLRDSKKYSRKEGKGMGNYRYYLCPVGVLKPEDMPEGWGLLYAHEKTIQVVVRPIKRESCYQSERNLLTSIMRRAIDGCPHLDRKFIRKRKKVEASL